MKVEDMKRIRVGDVFRISNAESACIQYLGKHPLMGECVAIFECTNMENGSAHVHVLFYPFQLNVKLSNLVFAQMQPMVSKVPESIRRPKIISNQKVQSWLIDDFHGTHEVHQLAEEEQSLPIGVVVSHQVVIDWINGNWSYLLGNYRI